MAERAQYAVGIDVGTTAIKLIVLDAQHLTCYEDSMAHPLYTEYPNWAEEDAFVWWEHTLVLLERATRYLSAENGGQTPQIRAIGVSGMVPAIVLLDDVGQPLRRSIQQNDARCVAQIEALKGTLNQDQLFAQTGGYTNQQHVLPRLMWISQHEPGVWARIDRICGSYDWIVHNLTGQWSLEENWAVESGLFDIHTRCWLTEQLDTYGIPLAWLPPVQSPLEIVGHVRPEVAQRTGLPEHVAVIAGSADHIASALSANVVEAGDLLIKFGGAGDILFCTEELVTHEQLFFDYHDIPGKYLLNGCMASSGSLVRWFVENFVPPSPTGNIYHELDDKAAQIGPGCDGLVVLPYLLGEKTPIFDPKARGVFFGLSLHHTPAHLFRAILESVIYGFRHHLDVLAERGLVPQRVFATNGGAKSRLWLQIAADILGLPLTSYKDHPGSSLGAAFLAGKAIDMYQEWAEIAECLPGSQFFRPNPKATETYDVTYQVYRNLYESLKDDFHLVSDYFDDSRVR